MARKRAPRTGGAGVGNNLINLYLQDYFLRRRQAEDDARQQTIRKETGLDQMAVEALEGVMSGKLHPNQLPPELTGRLPFDPSSFRPSDETLASPWYDQLRGAKTQVDVPTTDDTLSFFKTRGLDIAPQLGGREQAPTPEGGLPSANFDITSPPALQQAFNQRTSKLSAIDLAQEAEMDRKLAEARGTAYESGRGTEQATAEAFPAVLGRDRQSKEQENLLAQDQFKAMTPLEIARAGGISGAQFDATHTDARIRRAAEMSQLIAHVQGQERQAHPDPTSLQPSEGERRAGSMAGLLVKSYADLQPLMDAGVALKPAALQAAGSPAMSMGADFLGVYSPDEIAMASGFLNAASIITYTLSGQQTRAEELPRYAAIIAPFASDPEPVKEAKRSTFQAFIAAAQMNAGRSQAELGATLGRMVQEGKLDPSVFQSFNLAPGVAAGLETFLNGGQVSPVAVPGEAPSRFNLPPIGH